MKTRAKKIERRRPRQHQIARAKPATPIRQIYAGSPARVETAKPHRMATGDLVRFIGTNSTPVLEGPVLVTVLDANRFTIPVNVAEPGNKGWVAEPQLTPSDAALVLRKVVDRVERQNPRLATVTISIRKGRRRVHIASEALQVLLAHIARIESVIVSCTFHHFTMRTTKHQSQSMELGGAVASSTNRRFGLIPLGRIASRRFDGSAVDIAKLRILSRTSNKN